MRTRASSLAQSLGWWLGKSARWLRRALLLLNLIIRLNIPKALGMGPESSPAHARCTTTCVFHPNRLPHHLPVSTESVRARHDPLLWVYQADQSLGCFHVVLSVP